MSCLAQNEKLVDFKREQMKSDIRKFANIYWDGATELFAELIQGIDKREYEERKAREKVAAQNLIAANSRLEGVCLKKVRI